MPESHYPLVIVGAGAAGLGASEAATAAGVEHIVVEAAHRCGGRGLTELLGDSAIPVDLGCRWMHSASLNPYVRWADQLGFDYHQTGRVGEQSRLVFDGCELDAAERQSLQQAELEVERAIESNGEQHIDRAILDCLPADSRWLGCLSYWYSLMHSNDPDQVSLLDAYHYRDTEENWPLKQGYGALICRQGSRCPVRLNTAVSALDWSGGGVKLHTNRGTITADKAIITVSTGVLGAGDIAFTPALPTDRQQAIAALPMGNYNNLFYQLRPGTLNGLESEALWCDQAHCLGVHINPFGQPYLFACVAGRFAWWLERQGERASEAWFREILIKLFGGDFSRQLMHFKASAWGYDPWIKGAYSSALPGQGGSRTVLAQPLAGRLFFAGEATSTEFLNTAHGAYLSGHRAVAEAVAGVEGVCSPGPLIAPPPGALQR